MWKIISMICATAILACVIGELHSEHRAVVSSKANPVRIAGEDKVAIQLRFFQHTGWRIVTDKKDYLSGVPIAFESGGVVLHPKDKEKRSWIGYLELADGGLRITGSPGNQNIRIVPIHMSEIDKLDKDFPKYKLMKFIYADGTVKFARTLFF